MRLGTRAPGMLAAAALALVAAACDEPASAGRRELKPLESLTAADREAAETFAKARQLLDAGRDREAEPLLRRVVELAPRDDDALRALSDVLVRRKQFAEAAQFLARLVEARPEDQQARQRLFDALQCSKNHAGAEAAARAWTKSARDSSSAWYALGCALHDLGRLDLAVAALKQAGTLKAARADVRSRLGLVYLAQGKNADAEAAQRDAIQRDPHFADAWLRLGQMLAADPKRRGETIDAYRRAVQADPARLAWVRAELYRELRIAARSDETKNADAESEWKSLLRVAGRDMLPWGGLGAPPPATDAKEEKRLHDAVVAKPDDPPTRTAWAMHLHRKGDAARAVAEYTQAMQGDPGNARLRSALGAALLVQGDPASAEPQLREALRLDATDQTSWRNLAWALLQTGRDADARAAYDEALKLYESDRLARRGRGLARLHAGDLEGGRADVAASGWGPKEPR